MTGRPGGEAQGRKKESQGGAATARPIGLWKIEAALAARYGETTNFFSNMRNPARLPGRNVFPLERNVCLIFLLLSSTVTSGLQVPTMNGPQIYRKHHRRKAQSTTLHLIKGIQPSVEDEINREVEDANLSNIELLQRELENGANIFQVGAREPTVERVSSY